MSAVAPMKPTPTGGSYPPAKIQEVINVTVSAPDPPSEDAEDPKGINVLVAPSADSPASPGAALPKANAATPGPVTELRGWLMVLATLVASITYASGLSPPGGFEKLPMPNQEQQMVSFVDSTSPPYNPSPPHTRVTDPSPTTSGGHMVPILYTVSPARCRTFYYSNTAAFALSISIILLLGSQDLRKLAKIKAIEVLVGLDVMALVVAYIAAASFGSLQLLVCAGLVLVVPVALVVMSTRLCGNYFWDEL